METIKLDCTYEERISKKDNTKRYTALFVKLSPNFEKVIYLSVPEKALVESSHKE